MSTPSAAAPVASASSGTDDLGLASFLSKQALGDLRALAAAPAPLLVVLESPLVGAGALAGAELSRSWVSPEAWARDVRLVEPSAERWSVSEVDEHVVAAARTMPYERLVVVLDRAGTMSSAAADRMLLTLEEPMVPATFVLSVKSAAELIPTLRGRAGATVRLDPADPSDRVRALVRAGAQEDAATDAVELSGSQVALAAALARDAALREHARRLYGTPLTSASPVAAAHAANEALTELGKALAAATGSKAASASKAAARALLRELLGRRRTAVAAAARTAGPQEHLTLVEHLRAADEAERELATYASNLLVLTALLSVPSRTS